ncbi:hypothetical protein, partial [Escherichia coli]|uniref:hypothetical protein n=1 Tax=Escherichia coli TaxID=562 RepID=UPI001A7E0786
KTMILFVFITVISGHDKPQPPGCLLELKDLKTGFHSAPGFSLSGHCRLHWFKHGNEDCGEKS